MLIPLLVLVAAALLALLAGYGAREGADQAAVAAATAQLQGRDGRAAANAASPSWSKPKIVIAHGQATVTITPRVPGFVASVIDAERTVIFDAAAVGGGS